MSNIYYQMEMKESRDRKIILSTDAGLLTQPDSTNHVEYIILRCEYSATAYYILEITSSLLTLSYVSIVLIFAIYCMKHMRASALGGGTRHSRSVHALCSEVSSSKLYRSYDAERPPMFSDAVP